MKLFDPAYIKMNVMGIPIVGGYAPGSFVEVRQSAADFIKIMGVDGQGTRIRTEDTSGQIIFHLMHTSDANAALSVIRQGDVYSPNGQAGGPTQILDLNGQSFFFAGRSWLQKPPDAEFGRAAGERTWIVETDDLQQQTTGTNYV